MDFGLEQARVKLAHENGGSCTAIAFACAFRLELVARSDHPDY
ncbi:MAG: hypothetical protein ACFFGP_14660 [Promethearchaeota archaeon]